MPVLGAVVQVGDLLQGGHSGQHGRWAGSGWCVGKEQTLTAALLWALSGWAGAGKVWKAGGGAPGLQAAFQGPAEVGRSHMAQSKGEGVGGPTA